MISVGLSQRRTLASTLDLRYSELSLPSALIAGNTHTITVTAKDTSGNRINTGGETINLKVTSECTPSCLGCTAVAGSTFALTNPIDVTMTDNGDGTYTYNLNLEDKVGMVSFTVYATGSARGLSVNWYENYNWAAPIALSNIVCDLNYYWDGRTDLIVGSSYVAASAYFNSDIIAPITGDVTFFIHVNFRLKTTFNNVVVGDGSSSSYTFTKTLTKGNRYPLNLKWNNQGGDATLKVYWSYSGQAQTIIPSENYATTTRGVLGSLSKIVQKCGDGYKTGTEGCDDGNLTNGDGCSSTCTVESKWSCSGGNASTASTCIDICGDGFVVKTAAGYCDDGGTGNNDGCDSNCAVEAGWTCTLGDALNPSSCSDI